MKEQPNYYAILTANVRYSKLINANEKLLFAEITALSNSTGVCFASNNYFAELFDVTPQAISKWIKNLELNKFLVCQYFYKKDSKEIEKREIRCFNTVLDVSTCIDTYQHRIKDNSISSNNNTTILPINDGLYLSTDDIYEELKVNYPMYAKQVLADKNKCEAIYRNTLKIVDFEVGRLTLIKYLEIFLLHLDEYKNLHHNKTSFSNNFSNWFKMQKDKGKVELVYPKQEPIRYV